MTIELDDIAAAAIAVCATRLDASVSAEQFVALVERLIDAAQANAPESNLASNATPPPLASLAPRGRALGPALKYQEKNR